MKANELMNGDWVLINTYPEKVKFIGDTLIKVWGLDDSIDVDNVSPMPLTDDILEKNGWKIVTIPDISNGTEDWAIWSVDSEIEIPFRLQRGYDGHRWWIVVGVGGLLTHVDYVHELQHALCLCGIEEKTLFINF